MTDENRPPSAEERYQPPKINKRGYPVVDAMDPCWSLFAHDWPGLTADEAQDIFRKTRPPAE